MPVAQGINGTIIESTQTGLQRTAFNSNNPEGQRSSIRTIFVSSPIYEGVLSENDRSNLHNQDFTGSKEVKVLKAYAELLGSTVSNGFGFSESSVSLSFDSNKDTDDLNLGIDGIAVPLVTADKPATGHANLRPSNDLNDPGKASTGTIQGSVNKNFGTSIPNPSTDTLGQFFNSIVNPGV